MKVHEFNEQSDRLSEQFQQWFLNLEVVEAFGLIFGVIVFMLIAIMIYASNRQAPYY